MHTIILIGLLYIEEERKCVAVQNKHTLSKWSYYQLN